MFDSHRRDVVEVKGLLSVPDHQVNLPITSSITLLDLASDASVLQVTSGFCVVRLPMHGHIELVLPGAPSPCLTSPSFAGRHVQSCVSKQVEQRFYKQPGVVDSVTISSIA